MLVLLGLEPRHRLHRGNRLERRVEVLVHVHELLVQRDLARPAERGARFIGEQQRESPTRRAPAAERAQAPPRFRIARRIADRGERRAQRVQVIGLGLGPFEAPVAALPALRVLVLGHASWRVS